MEGFKFLRDPMDTIASTDRNAIRRAVDRILSSRQISRQDQRTLMTLLSGHCLSSQEKLWVDRIYEDLHRGLIRAID
jgi:hypothetical protein